MIRKILVANRGEIACRVFRTARDMGIRTVAVFSDADRDALHVRSADEAWHIGPAPAAKSYLDMERLLEAVTASGADAVHPGYGFLAENPDFAEAVTAAGAIFIGPTPESMRAVGDKRAARRVMRNAGLSIVPGEEDVDSLPDLLRVAEETGYPLMVKAAAGGGGRGMRRVDSALDLERAFESCRREAQAAFGDGRLLAERCIESARHIEVQVFADSRGSIVHLFERDCSAQRRHQKILEEAPAPGLDPGLARDIREAAVAAARAVGYLGAGTVEFLVPAQDSGFYFLEINARLQVEHPVTEAVSGQDLVEWQIRVAAGEPLPLGQDSLRMSGHAIEARFCAEDPANGFMPAPGTLRRLTLPGPCGGLRIDTGVESGDTIPPDYDSMIAKVIAHGRDRRVALARLRTALSEVRVAGPETNLEFLLALAETPEFQSGSMETGLVERMLERGELSGCPPPGEVVIAVALSAHLRDQERWRLVRRKRFGGESPFSSAGSWRMGAPAKHLLRLRWGDHEYTTRLQPLPAESVDADGGRSWVATVDEGGEPLVARPAGSGLVAIASKDRSCWTLVRAEAGEPAGTGWQAFLGTRRWRFDSPSAAETNETAVDKEGAFRAPLPGHILRHHVQAGDLVEAGDALVTLEAMKTEHTVRAPVAGRILALHGATGGLVEEGEELLAFEARPSGSPGT